MRKLFKYIKYFEYYIELLGKRMSGKGNMNAETNGEFILLRNMLEAASREHRNFVYLDIGANIGENALYAARLGKKHNIDVQIFAFEPVPEAYHQLSENCEGYKIECINYAVGKSDETINFYVRKGNRLAGDNSAIQHYYLKDASKISVSQTTIDNFVRLNNLERLSFVKLDIEGSELNALEGAKSSLARGMIDFIQIEYNETWIPANASIEKVLKLLEKVPYSIYRICNSELLGISSYHYTIEDFYFANLLIARDGIPLPGKYSREVSPIIDPNY